MDAGIAVIGVFALGIGLWLYAHKDAPKICTLLFLVAGVGLVGSLTSTIFAAIRGGMNSAASALGSFAGVSASAVIAVAAVVATLEIVIKGLWKKKAKPRRWHPWLAFLLPAIIVISGAPVLITVVDWITGLLSTGGSHLQANMGGGS